VAREIERKFLLRDAAWRAEVARSVNIIQGYLATTEGCSVRVRIADGQAAINLKSATLGVSRTEFDYPIPVADARYILRHLCALPPIEKVRHLVYRGRHTWEIDEFGGANHGLLLAEIELDDPAEAFDPPAWLGDEVSHDPRYYNTCLAQTPYQSWSR